MATAKKPSGLGRGLGDLLDDNAPNIRAEHSKVAVHREGDPIRITPAGSAEIKTKKLFESQHKNRSVKANFKK